MPERVQHETRSVATLARLAAFIAVGLHTQIHVLPEQEQFSVTGHLERRRSLNGIIVVLVLRYTHYVPTTPADMLF